MNEIETLFKLDPRELPPLKSLALDDLRQRVLKNLHLELGAGSVLCLLSPSYAVLLPGANDRAAELVSKRAGTLDYLKETLVQNLAVYSVLLDVNSYFIEQNDWLVLARLRDLNAAGGRFEVQYYTQSPMELLSHYEDKIYIGRDFVDLFNFRRKYYGLREHIAALKDQSDRLVDKAAEKLRRPNDYKSFFQEIRESVGELAAESQSILESLPPQPDYAKLDEKDLIEINAQYRTINHFLIELNDEVAEFENLLRFKTEIGFVRYVTKYKKDLTNLISLFNIKINGCLGQRIVQARSKTQLV
jgi:hypothetical protein